jgi:hypothetical protein
MSPSTGINDNQLFAILLCISEVKSQLVSLWVNPPTRTLVVRVGSLSPW